MGGDHLPEVCKPIPGIYLVLSVSAVFSLLTGDAIKSWSVYNENTPRYDSRMGDQKRMVLLFTACRTRLSVPAFVHKFAAALVTISEMGKIRKALLWESSAPDAETQRIAGGPSTNIYLPIHKRDTLPDIWCVCGMSIHDIHHRLHGRCARRMSTKNCAGYGHT